MIGEEGTGFATAMKTLDHTRITIAAQALGIAQGALDDITLLASDKVPMLSPVALGGSPLFQLDLATADTELRAARSLLYDDACRLWETASAGDVP